jgi:hypothetical protein
VYQTPRRFEWLAYDASPSFSVARECLAQQVGPIHALQQGDAARGGGDQRLETCVTVGIVRCHAELRLGFTDHVTLAARQIDGLACMLGRLPGHRQIDFGAGQHVEHRDAVRGGGAPGQLRLQALGLCVGAWNVVGLPCARGGHVTAPVIERGAALGLGMGLRLR